MNNSIIHEFPHIPANKKSIYMRKPSFGVGINDAEYLTYALIDGKKKSCPIYQKWQSMLQRCYSPKYQKSRPTYIGCTVCDDWLLFSNFREWMVSQDWAGKDLDKDILFPNNKVYSPSTCLFVSPKINSMLTDRTASRGKYLIGVNLNKKTNKFISMCRIDGRQEYLGLFSTEKEAHNEFLRAKSELVAVVAEKQTEPLKGALIGISAMIKKCIYYTN